MTTADWRPVSLMVAHDCSFLRAVAPGRVHAPMGVPKCPSMSFLLLVAKHTGVAAWLSPRTPRAVCANAQARGIFQAILVHAPRACARMMQVSLCRSISRLQYKSPLRACDWQQQARPSVLEATTNANNGGDRGRYGVMCSR